MRRLITTSLLLAAFAPACSDDDDTTQAISGSDVMVTNDVAPDTSADVAVTPGPPLAAVYPVSPTDTPELETVELKHLFGTDGTLVGPYAYVRNCVDDLEEGSTIPFELGGGIAINVTVCAPRATATAGEDGSYLHITPPATPEDDDGQFAEVMMYHHMQLIHDYFKDVHGLTDRDESLEALVNVQAHIDLCDEWARLPNAAFFPAGTFDALGVDIDFGITGDAIIFSGTATKNFAYDAAVIYHEYTHAMLGATRLNAAFLDEQGLNVLPGALNEAYADYFAITLIGDSLMGSYSLNDLGEFAICGIPLGGGANQARDADNDLVCPNDLTAQVHADSELFSSALWEIRQALGAEDADRVILAAVLTLTESSGFTVAAEATIDAAEQLLGGEAVATVEAAFNRHGVLGCNRVLPIDKIGARGLPVQLYSPSDLSPNPFPGYLPGPLQFKVDVPAGTKELVLAIEAGGGGGGLPIPGLGGGGGETAMALAFKKGDEPIIYSLIPGAATNDAEITVDAVDNEGLSVRLAGNCLTEGSWTFAVHNKGGGASISAITASTSDETPATVNFDTCGASE